MRKYISVIGILLLFIVYGCNRTTKEVTNTNTQPLKPKVATHKPVEKIAAYENFDKFYNQFHYDTVFQISRIKFPLKGYSVDTSEIYKEWKKENWVMHRFNINDIDTMQFKFEKVFDSNIYIEGGGFKNERIFKRINGNWYLISYIDENL